MNASLLAMLNDAEQELVRAAEPAALDELDEDALASLRRDGGAGSRYELPPAPMQRAEPPGGRALGRSGAR